MTKRQVRQLILVLAMKGIKFTLKFNQRIYNLQTDSVQSGYIVEYDRAEEYKVLRALGA